MTWDNIGNNKAFLAQPVVMTPNNSLSIPNALKRERPEDYYENTATIEWPLGPGGKAFPIEGRFFAAVVFKDGGNIATAKEFVRFLVAEGWLAHYLDFSGERMMPAMPKLLERRSGSTRATRTAWPRRCRSLPGPCTTTTLTVSGDLARRPGLAGERLGECDPPRRGRGHQPRAGGRRGDRPDQADPERSEQP